MEKAGSKLLITMLAVEAISMVPSCIPSTMSRSPPSEALGIISISVLPSESSAAYCLNKVHILWWTLSSESASVCPTWITSFSAVPSVSAASAFVPAFWVSPPAPVPACEPPHAHKEHDIIIAMAATIFLLLIHLLILIFLLLSFTPIFPCCPITILNCLQHFL